MAPFFRIAALLCLSVTCSTRALAAPAHSDLNRLFLLAERNVNTAYSFEENLVETVSTPTWRERVSLLDVFDEKRNREAGHEFRTVSRRSGTRWHVSTYSLSIVMEYDHTYYRFSGPNAAWRLKPGYGFADRTSGMHWVRQPYRVHFDLRAHLLRMVNVQPGLLHVRAQALSFDGAFDFWITRGGRPYIVRIVQQGTAVRHGQRETFVQDVRLSKFNRSLHVGLSTALGFQP